MLYFNPLDYFFIILNDYVLLYIIISKKKNFIIIFLKCTCVIYEVLSDWLIHYVLFTSYKLVSKVVSFWFTFHSQNTTFFHIFWDQSRTCLIHILVVILVFKTSLSRLFKSSFTGIWKTFLGVSLWDRIRTSLRPIDWFQKDVSKTTSRRLVFTGYAAYLNSRLRNRTPGCVT